MVLSTLAPRPAAKPATRCSICRHGGWILSLSYAALLAAAIWKLDDAQLPVRVTAAPLGALSMVLDWTRSRLGPWADTRPGNHDASAALTSQQTQPEGWPSWTDAPATPPTRQQR